MASIEESSAAPVETVRSYRPANDIRVCDKCRHIRLKSVVSKLQKAAPEAEIKVGCKSYCGPCRKHAFVFVNGRYVTAPSEDEAVEKASKFIKK